MTAKIIVIFASLNDFKMKHHLSKIYKFIVLISVFFSINANAQYQNDAMGNGYVSRTVDQPADYDGKVVCTVIKKPTLDNVKKAIIYVHGYNDYFFQSALGDSVNAHGFNFYAVDLRKYGRSILPHQDPFFCKKMDEYFADIDSTIAIARQEGNEKIYLMGHSTGGLTTSLYTGQTKVGCVDGLILNSPFFDWNFGPMMEGIVIPLVSFIGMPFKRIKVQSASKEIDGYAQSLLKEYHGEWDYNTDYKKPKGHPKRAGWVHAINRGQIKVHRRLDIKCPILLMSSDKSAKETVEWNERERYADIVLDAKEIQKYGKRIGKNVTSVTIKDGKHDLLLSEKEARDNAYKTIFQWLDNQGK